MAGKQYEQGLTSGAFGQAPMGDAPNGQRPGEMFPGNGRMHIDRSNPNPSEPSIRASALYATIEQRGHMKREAGSRMASQVKANNNGILGMRK